MAYQLRNAERHHSYGYLVDKHISSYKMKSFLKKQAWYLTINLQNTSTATKYSICKKDKIVQNWKATKAKQLYSGTKSEFAIFAVVSINLFMCGLDWCQGLNIWRHRKFAMFPLCWLPWKHLWRSNAVSSGEFYNFQNNEEWMCVCIGFSWICFRFNLTVHCSIWK